MKQLLPTANATFNATAKTIAFSTTVPASIGHILHVTNITRGVLYFQPQGGALLSGVYASPTLTLACDTTGHADEDELLIFYDDGLGMATQTTLAAILAKQISAPATEAKQDTLIAKDFATQTTLAAILEKIIAAPATEITLSAILSDLQGKSDAAETQPVSVVSLPLPDGAATQTTAADILAKLSSDPATQTTLAAILSELQNKADLSETQPVSASSLPLPSGAATEAKQDALNATDFATQTTLYAILQELMLKADLSNTQPVSAASLPLPDGAATQTTLADVLAKVTTPTYADQYGFQIPAFDYKGFTYDGSDNVGTVVYKTGGAGGSTVATLTFAYSGTNITSITKS